MNADICLLKLYRKRLNISEKENVNLKYFRRKWRAAYEETRALRLFQANYSSDTLTLLKMNKQKKTRQETWEISGKKVNYEKAKGYTLQNREASKP